MSDLPRIILRMGDKLSDLGYHDLAVELVEQFEEFDQLVKFVVAVVMLSEDEKE